MRRSRDRAASGLAACPALSRPLRRWRSDRQYSCRLTSLEVRLALLAERRPAFGAVLRVADNGEQGALQRQALRQRHVEAIADRLAGHLHRQWRVDGDTYGKLKRRGGELTLFDNLTDKPHGESVIGDHAVT